jgi:hypothetical protein
VAGGRLDDDPLQPALRGVGAAGDEHLRRGARVGVPDLAGEAAQALAIDGGPRAAVARVLE